MGMTIGQRVKELIKQCGLTQLELAKETKIPQSTISRITSAEHVDEIKPDHLSMIAEALGVTKEWLRSGEIESGLGSESEKVEELQDGRFAVSDEARLKNMKDNGLLGVYQDRAAAFRAFYKIWLREKHIRMVGSSIEGFKRGIGIDAEELLGAKLMQTDPERIIVQIMLTYAEFAIYREEQEEEEKGYIVHQIRATTNLLNRLKKAANPENKLEWRYFKGAPTCFTIIAGDYMLLNPYLYMQPGYFNFSLIVEKTKKSVFDIYSRYELYHFSKAWHNSKLCVEDPGIKAAEEIIAVQRGRSRSQRSSKS